MITLWWLIDHIPQVVAVLSDHGAAVILTNHSHANLNIKIWSSTNSFAGVTVIMTGDELFRTSSVRINLLNALAIVLLQIIIVVEMVNCVLNPAHSLTYGGAGEL